MERSNLHASTHPHPHNIKWLNQGKGLQVNSRCLISLSIRKNYQDKLWCDVITMDACHILPGRPWMFAGKIMNDSHLNIHYFSKGVKKATFVLFSPSQLHKSKPQKKPEHSNLFLTYSEPLLKASYHEFGAFKELILTT